MVMNSCSAGTNEHRIKYKRIEDVPQSVWEKLNAKRIVFGHQSVGENIIEGLNSIISNNPFIKLKVIDTNLFNSLEPGTFAHFRIGENGTPLSKITQFERLAKEQFGNRVDFAFFKLCFVDITTRTDIEATAENYIDTLNKIKAAYPQTQFILFTCPLTESKITWKTKLKRILGLGTLWEFNDNIKRNQFNKLIIARDNQRIPIFDLAGIESTHKDGTRSKFEFEGKEYFSLSPDYSLDGGHLNTIGSRVVAEQLLVMLANFV